MTATQSTTRALGAFVEARSEEAFREIVEQHGPAVLGTARRILRGNETQAREVMQAVFVILARRAGELSPTAVLGAWLHRVTCTQAASLVREETRRRRREATAAAYMQNDTSTQLQTGGEWREIAPVLDEELQRLPAAERTAIALRFLENQTWRATGATMGITEDGARKRISRALEKLRSRLERRGIAVPSATLLGTLLVPESSSAMAPAFITETVRAALAAPLPAVTGIAMWWSAAAAAGVAALAFVGGRAVGAVPTTQAVLTAERISRPMPPVAGPEAEPRPVVSHLTTWLVDADSMLERIERATAAEMPLLFDDYHAELERTHFDLLCQRWLSLDPSGALRHLRQKHDDSLGKVYAAWARRDFSAALISSRQELGRWKQGVMSSVLATKIPGDIAGFLKLASENGAPKPEPSDVAKAFRVLAAEGMDKALEAFAGCRSSHLREPAAKALASIMCDADQAQAEAWMLGLTDASERHYALQGIVETLVKVNPQRALDLLSAKPKSDETSRLWGPAAAVLMKHDPDTVVKKALERLQPKDRWIVAREIPMHPTLPALDKLRHLRSLLEHEEHDPLSSHETSNLRRSFPWGPFPGSVEEAMASISALAGERGGAIRDLLIRRFAFKVIESNPSGWSAFISGLPMDARSIVALSLLQFGRRDLTEPRLALLEHIDPCETKRIKEIGSSLAAIPDAERAEFLATVPASHRPAVIRGLAASLTHVDRESTIKWLGTLPPGDAAPAAVGIGEQMAAASPSAAMQWVDGLSRGPVRDHAIHEMSPFLAKKDPQAAWVWALSVEDATVRIDTLTTVYASWSKKGTAAAQALASAALADDQRAVILAGKKKKAK